MWRVYCGERFYCSTTSSSLYRRYRGTVVVLKSQNRQVQGGGTSTCESGVVRRGTDPQEREVIDTVHPPKKVYDPSVPL